MSKLPKEVRFEFETTEERDAFLRAAFPGKYLIHSTPSEGVYRVKARPYTTLEVSFNKCTLRQPPSMAPRLGKGRRAPDLPRPEDYPDPDEAGEARRELKSGE